MLEEAGLNETRINGAARPRRLKPDAVEALWDWLGQYRAQWEAQFQKMDAVLDGLSTKQNKHLPANRKGAHHEHGP